MTRAPDTQEVWARLLVDALVASGVADVVLSPGSRSTPLVLALVGDGRLRVHDVIDERSAGFVALGMARVDGVPTALVCTSGSAPSHYHPAIVEADASRIPMLVVSANRPFALQQAGESQTVDQTKLFGDHVRFFADIGEPSEARGDLRAMRRVVAQAVFASRHPEPGPVHIDARFVKPLEPIPHGQVGPLDALERALREVPPPRFHAPVETPSAEGLRWLAERLRSAVRPMVVVGPAVARDGAASSLVRFARSTGVPVYVEAASGARFAAGASALLGAIDAVFRVDAARSMLAPDFVLQVGRTPIAGSFARLAAEADFDLALLTEGAFLDPWSRATQVIQGPPGLSLDAITDLLSAAPPSLDTHWARTLARLDRRALDAAVRIAGEEDASEGAVALAVVESLPARGRLVLGNSLAIREVDAWVAPSDTPLEVVSQRGASGIDGLVAGLFGAQLASPKPTILLFGDVSFAHDVGSLSLLRRLEVPTVVVVVDNGGGRIFEQLPIAARAPSAMQHFVTPPGLDVAAVAAAMGVRSSRTRSGNGLRAELQAALAFDGTTVVVVEVEPSGAVAQNRRLFAEVDAAVRAEVDR